MAKESKDCLMPKESAKLIAGTAQDVFIRTHGVKRLASVIIQGLKNNSFVTDSYLSFKYHPKADDPRAVDWIFLLSTLNFSFWTPKNKRKWSVYGQTGYFALCAAVKRAIEEGKSILDPKYYSEITESDIEKIFLGEDDVIIPLIHERRKVLHETGKVLLSKYQGTFTKCIKSCEGSAVKLLKLIVSEFESYRDEALYIEQKVSFYKRAQILIGDIWSCFGGCGIGEFHDIDSITMFADYRIPQVFLHFEAIHYSDSLLKKLESDELLENGCREEVEIRGCSIEIVERVCAEIRETIRESEYLGLKTTLINAIVIDQILWNYRRKNAYELKLIPFHKTRTIYY